MMRIGLWIYFNFKYALYEKDEQETKPVRKIACTNASIFPENDTYENI